MITNNKPQLHVSMLDMLSRCGIQFQRRYGARFGCWHEEEIIPPGVALATGTAVHTSVEKNLRNKMETKGELLHREEVAAAARDKFEEVWNGGMMLSEDEAIDPDGTFGKSVDQTVSLALLHHDILAPQIQPLAVEDKFVIHLDNYPFDLSGQKDIRESDCIRDTKTRAATPPADAVRSLQMAMYALSEKIERGKLPDEVRLDVLVKTKTQKIVTLRETPEDSWMNPLFRRVERATEIIQTVKEGKNAFTPADPDNWVCSAKYCGYAHTCPFWSGK